jgi:hypothetical protein
MEELPLAELEFYLSVIYYQGTTFAVESHAFGISDIDNNLFASILVKDAIADYFMEVQSQQ